jgi:hypothetical protein
MCRPWRSLAQARILLMASYAFHRISQCGFSLFAGWEGEKRLVFTQLVNVSDLLAWAPNCLDLVVADGLALQH